MGRAKKPNKNAFKIITITLSFLIILLVIVTIALMNTYGSKEESLIPNTANVVDNVVKEPEVIVEEKPTTVVPEEKKPVVVKPVLEKPVPVIPEKNPNGIYNYGNYSLTESSASNEKIGFWFGRNKNFERPNGALPIETFKKFNSYYIGPDKKVIYLTFDEGNLNTQAGNNMDTLKKHGIKGTFFVTKSFIEANPDIIKRMVAEGHVVGNHTWNHKDMATMASNSPEEFIKELAATEDTFRNITGVNMDRVFRFPEGTFSERALDFVNQMGYKSIFWSFAYKDWDPTWNTREEALSWMENYYHPGAIYLVHGANVANAQALDEFITFMEGQGYSFDLPTNI